MRTFFITFIVLLATWPAPSQSATRNFGVNGFDRIRVEGPFKVSVATGVAPSATVSGSSAAIDRVDIDVQGTTLIVSANLSSWGGYPGKDQGPVEIKIGTHELSQARLNGSGSLVIDKAKGLSFLLSTQGSGSASIQKADVDQLTVAVAGTGSATVAGRAGKLTAWVRGVSSFDGSALNAKNAVLRAEGPSTVKADVSNEATIQGNGTATIALTGKPTCTNKLVGSANVTGCR
ncbi:GIN domain-containing protein [Sphingomonas hankyongi]|uniref:DUF2807 domain-containing protein n=1 Tax=Sphingomonas hankyongi TaxID=2908209 RepID=A0ABT0S4E7_9SPHN|nr:DUF2807 domain-containing protein [Sphingomonas hankyongi]MCL6730733.1 DUF2807 domain-containing protein [Sphingomonas hankyongi]